MDAALAAARFAHFAATMLMFGAAAFAPAPAECQRDLRRVGPPLAILSLASALVWAALVARDMAGGDLDLATLGAVLTDTQFGCVWLGRLAILVLLVAVAARPGRARLWTAGLAVASLGLVDHAAAQGGVWGAAHRLNRAAHLLCAAGWLGGLPAFLVCLRLFLRDPARRDALAAMRCFSFAGHFAVAAVVISGAAEIALTSGRWPWPPRTPYRGLLDLKIACIAAMVALALINRYVWAPRLARSAGAGRALAAGAVAETGLALAALALVSVFALLDPN